MSYRCYVQYVSVKCCTILYCIV